MEPEVRFAKIEALLHAMAERENQMEIRFNKRMDRAEQRMDRAEQRGAALDARMEKTDRQIKAMQLLMRQGMRMLATHDQDLRAMKEDTRELKQALKVFLNSMRRGNGNGRVR